GGAIVAGHYADGEIAQALRPDGRVVYSNGIGAAGVAPPPHGDWARLIVNAATCVHPGGSLWGATSDGTLFGVDVATGHGTLVGPLPTSGNAGSTEIEFDPASGRAYLQTRDGFM